MLRRTALAAASVTLASAMGIAPAAHAETHHSSSRSAHICTTTKASSGWITFRVFRMTGTRCSPSGRNVVPPMIAALTTAPSVDVKTSSPSVVNYNDNSSNFTDNSVKTPPAEPQIVYVYQTVYTPCVPKDLLNQAPVVTTPPTPSQPDIKGTKSGGAGGSGGSGGTGYPVCPDPSNTGSGAGGVG